MAFIKRIFLFLALNILVVITIEAILALLGFGGANQYRYRGYSASGLDYQSLAVFCLVWGMVGSFMSLLLSRVMAKWMMGVRVIDPSTPDSNLQELVQMVHNLARSAHLPAMPEVGIYESPAPNAFATGPTKSRALVAVSTGLLSRMSTEEVYGVLGHEITHVANGDMVTMTLLQGVVNAFVMFLSRVLAFVLAQAMRGDRDDRDRGMSYGLYYFVQFVLEIVFMILGSMLVAWFSRRREYRADAGGARLAGRENMIHALEALKRTFEVEDPSVKPAVQALQISGHGRGLLAFFASHPPLDERIARLREST